MYKRKYVTITDTNILRQAILRSKLCQKAPYSGPPTSNWCHWCTTHFHTWWIPYVKCYRSWLSIPSTFGAFNVVYVLYLYIVNTHLIFLVFQMSKKKFLWNWIYGVYVMFSENMHLMYYNSILRIRSFWLLFYMF